MRFAAVALIAFVLAGSASGAPTGARVAFVHDGEVVVADLPSRPPAGRASQRSARPGRVERRREAPPDAGRIVGGAGLPTTRIAWAPVGETGRLPVGRRRAPSLDPVGRLADDRRPRLGCPLVRRGRTESSRCGRKEHPAQGARAHDEVWTWQNAHCAASSAPLAGDTTPIVEGFASDGRVLWWNDLWRLGLDRLRRADALRDRQKLGQTLVFPDYVSVCGSHLVLARGRDRYTTRGKSIVLDGHDISRRHDALVGVTVVQRAAPSSPQPAGALAASAASAARELRSILRELAPKHVQLDPAAGRLDRRVPAGAPRRLGALRADTQTLGDGTVTERASLDLLAGGVVRPIASLTTTVNDLSQAWEPNTTATHGWPQLVAVSA